MSYVITNAAAAAAIANGDAFTNAGRTFSGETGASALHYGHHLHPVWRDAYNRHRDAGRIAYTVWSYGTPIAWRTDGGWVEPAANYSVTTARHQSITRGATRVVGRWAAAAGAGAGARFVCVDSDGGKCETVHRSATACRSHAGIGRVPAVITDGAPSPLIVTLEGGGYELAPLAI